MFRAILKEPEVSFDTGRVIARHEIVGGNYREWYADQNLYKEYELDLKQYRNPRSKDANSYFHVLCRKIADRIGISSAEVKNKMISRYGQYEIIDGSIDYWIVRDEVDVTKYEDIHLQPTSQTQVLNGKLYRVYARMRGVGLKHDKAYDTKEMSILIDGTISEAKEIGLTEAEIMSTKEKNILREVYGID